MAAKSLDADPALAIGQQINNRWRILDKLGEGGFGAVFKVIDGETNEELALKVESKKEEESLLKTEVAVAKLLARTKARRICKFIDDGEAVTFRYMVMQLLGRSLSELRKSAKDMRFSTSTTIRLGIQCLDGIEALHKIGFIHRDVKPGNFAMGKTDADKRSVFLLDFGLCRKFIGDDGQMRPPRKVVGFRGTVRYASVNVHLRKELGRHDDLWGLFYSMIELRTGDLPWRRITDKDVVMKKKQETSMESLLECLNEPEFFKMAENLNGLQYKDTPNYTWFHLQLKQIALRNKFADDNPYDWEPGGESFETCCRPPAKKKKAKSKSKPAKSPVAEERSSAKDDDPKKSGA